MFVIKRNHRIIATNARKLVKSEASRHRDHFSRYSRSCVHVISVFSVAVIILHPVTHVLAHFFFSLRWSVCLMSRTWPLSGACSSVVESLLIVNSLCDWREKWLQMNRYVTRHFDSQFATRSKSCWNIGFILNAKSQSDEWFQRHSRRYWQVELLQQPLMISISSH